MSVIRKLVGEDEEHRSRFHTRRGSRLPLKEILRAPIMLTKRLRPSSTPLPWMARGAVDRLDHLLMPQMTLLEMGSGSSTPWFGNRTRVTVSLEPDARWAKNTPNLISNVPCV